MNIAIIGRSEILFDTIEYLQKKGHNIKLIITAREAPEYKKKANDFKKIASEIGAVYIYTSNINNKKYYPIIKKVGKIDIGISFNYINIISKDVIKLFTLGILNAHGGDLPRYRGNACQAWAIINGEKKIGLCIYKMIPGQLDNGDIIMRDYYPIDINTKIGEVYSWIKKRIPDLFSEALNKLQKNNEYILEKQSKDFNKILRCYPRLPEDAKIDWKLDNKSIIRLINASGDPYPGAYCFYNDKKISIIDAEAFKDEENYLAIPGQISEINKSGGYITVITGKGKIKINKIKVNNHAYQPANIIKSIRKRLK